MGQQSPEIAAMRRARTLVTLALIVPLGAALALAGPLDPPAGPIASTPGPEPRIAINQTNTPGDADSVFRITQPGSYYLAGNITVPTGLVGVEIAMSDLTLDLNGFQIVGLLNTSGNGVEIDAGIERRNVVVRNGSIVQCGGNGIDLSNGSACVVENVNSGYNSGTGIVAGTNSRISDSTASFNTRSGFSVSAASTVSSCVAESNTEFGFTCGDGVVITGCAAIQNSMTGIRTIEAATITGCASSKNLQNGFTLSQAGTIQHCTAQENTLTGIELGIGGSVRGCTTNGNGYAGIACQISSVIEGNLCTGDGSTTTTAGGGIVVLGSGNRIVENSVVQSDRGYFCTGTNNYFARNSAAFNALNWSIVPGNVCLIVQSAVNIVQISGDAGGVVTGPSDPNCNYTH